MPDSYLAGRLGRRRPQLVAMAVAGYLRDLSCRHVWCRRWELNPHEVALIGV